MDKKGKSKNENGHKIWNLLYVSLKLGRDKSQAAKEDEIYNRMKGAKYAKLVNKTFK